MKYTYKCKCGKEFERECSISERDEQKCECGEKAIRKVSKISKGVTAPKYNGVKNV